MPPGQLKARAWSRLMTEFPDQAVSSAIIGICQFGARIGYEGPRPSTTIHPNLSSAMIDAHLVTCDIQKELSQDRLDVFPEANCLPQNYIASPLGLTDKADGSKRRIHHLSYPDSGSTSINSQIPEHYGTITYSTIQDAIEAVQLWGRNCILVKRDFESAFRHIPVSPLDSALLGFHWEDLYYTERYLPFGLRTAPYLFNLFAEVFHWLLDDQLKKSNLPVSVIHYLDDFFLVLPPKSKLELYTTKFAQLCSEVGLSIKDSKSEEGSIATFAGIEVDTGMMVIRLPPSKLEKARTIVRTALQKNSLSLTELQRITGYLNFVSVVVPLGRTFLRRLYNMELYFPPGNVHQRQRISSDRKKDLQWWASVLSGIPQRSIATQVRETIAAWTDAASSKGLGAFYISQRQTIPQPEAAFSILLPTTRMQTREHINTLEMRAVEQAFLYWGEAWKGKKVVLHVDNRAVAHGLENGTIRGASMHVLRRCCLLATEHDIELEMQWIPTQENALADALSHLDVQKIADLAPQLIYPECNLQQRGLLIFNNRASQPQPLTTFGGD